MRQEVLLGVLDTRRTQYFMQAAKQAGLAPLFWEWGNWQEKIKESAQTGVVMKIDPPRWNSCVLKELDSLVIPAGIIYQIHKTKKGAMAAMAAGTVIMAAVGVAGNALVMIPFYSNFMPLENILAAGAAINPAVSNVWTFALFCVGPFNVVKGIVVSLITALVYKRVSGVIHSVRVEKKKERLAR